MTEPLRRIQISCVDLDGKAAVLFYDLKTGSVMDDPTDFLWALSDDGQLDPKTVSDASFVLRRFWEHLGSKGIGQCRDSDIEGFRDAEFKSVMASNKAKQKHRIAKNSVNVRIRLVYRLLTWLQANGRTPTRSIGPTGCRVRSSLPDEQGPDGVAALTWRSTSSLSNERSRYPLAYRRVGTRSKHATKFTPSEELRFAVISSIHATASSDYLAHRNALIIDIADTVGWRRETINSITLGQVEEALDVVESADYAVIVPSVQKFGYVEAFDVPGWLVDRMGHFVRDYLKPTAANMRLKLSPETRFFLSIKGRPLKDQSITNIVSNAMRAAGGPRFAATHAFRRKFANDEIEDENRYRRENGLDTSAASVAASVSIRMGQHDPDSVYAYVSKSLTAERIGVDEQRREHLAAVERQVVALRARVRELEGSLSLSMEASGAQMPAQGRARKRR